MFQSKISNTEDEIQLLEVALKEKEQRSTIFNQSFQLFGLIKPDGTLIEVNQTVLDFGGLTHSLVINRPFWSARWWTKETQAQLQEAIARATEGEIVSYEVDIQGAENTTASIDFSIKPIKDETGQVILLLASGREIGERKAQAEIHLVNAQLEERFAQQTAQLEATNRQKQELLQRETQAQAKSQLYADIVQNMQFGLNVWRLEDPNDITSFRLVATNPAASQQIGISLKNCIGKRITECFPNLLAQNRASLELYAEVALCGTSSKNHYETYYHDQQISASYFSVKVFPLPDRCVGIAFDNITKTKQAEQSLQQRTEELTRLTTSLMQTTALLQKRNQELDQFAYVTSHDLKAPLRAIASLSEWIEEDLADQIPQENQYQMRLLRGRVRRMEALINGLLEYSRVGRSQTKIFPVNVGSLLKEVIDSLAPPSTFTIEVAPGMPILTTKRLPLQQVFSNLIGNGIKHHDRADGYVKISVEDKGKFYEFAISDDGPGIAPEYHEKIFVIFQTLEARDRKENTGIGLSLVKKIVETEGGTISIESTEDAGSTFRFTWLKQLLS